MKINCPHCKRNIEVIPESTATVCPSCGSRLNYFDVTLPHPPAPDRIVTHFELIEQVGRGQFGDVWKARDVVLDRFVAVKIPRMRQLDPATVQLFVREARAAAGLRHDNIVAVHEVVQDHEAVYIVSDFIQGVTLADELNYKRRSPRESAELCATIADALDYAHQNGVTAHRDVKPGNIMIDTAGKPYVMDFGLAKLEAADFTITVAGQILGTPAYMSPEQAQGITADHRSDVYSLGVVLYELLTGKRPFTGETRLLVQQILTEEPRAPRKLDKSVPRPLETICLKAMSKDPNRRYASAAELSADLRRFLRGEPIKARPVSPAERGWRWARRNPVVAGAGATAALLAVVLGGVLWQRHLETLAGFRDVELETIPPGAKVVFVPVDDVTRLPQPDDAVRPSRPSPVAARLKPGTYLVVADLADHGFHEVYRFVPEDPDAGQGPYNHTKWTSRSDGAIELPAITIPAAEDVIADMTLFEGGTFEMGSEQLEEAPKHSHHVDDFYLDRTEVTIADYRAIKALPLKLVGHPADEPVTLINFDQALEFAELAGKRLMTEAEYEYAATQRGTHAFPWGDDETQVVAAIFQTQPVRQPAFDQTPTDPPVYGLFSNVTEWTDSLHIPYLPREKPQPEALQHQISISRVLRGGPRTEIEPAEGQSVPSNLLVGPRLRAAINHARSHPFVGFRCAGAHPPFID